MSAARMRLPDARTIGVTTPSGGADTSAARALISSDMRSADTRHVAPITIQRWEAEGGALGANSRA